MSVLEKNLSVLGQRQPEVARSLEGEERSPEVELQMTRQGLPIHRYRGKLLHSQWDPHREARRCVADFDAEKPWVFGFGDGYHVEELLKKGQTETVVVLEPDGRLLRAVLEDRDLAHVLNRVSLLVDEPLDKVASRAPADKASWYLHPPSSQIHRRLLEAVQALSSYRPHEEDALRILVVGPVYGGSYPIACYVKEALDSLGHLVSFVDLTAFYPGYQELQNGDPTSDLLRSLEQLLSQLIERRTRAFSPDVVVFLAQAPVCEESLKRIQEDGIGVAYWFVEDYRRMPYWRRLAPFTDAFFVIQREAEEAIRAVGASCVRYLPMAALPGTHEPHQLSANDIDRYGSAVSFVGAGYRNRRNFLARLTSLDLKVWGNEWEGSPTVLEEVVQEDGRRVSTEETVKIFCASQINLNLHSSPHHEAVDPHGDFVNPRTFEIAGCRAFQLVDRRSLLPDLFNEQELVVFDDLKEAREKIDHFLGDENERRRYAEKAYQRVLREHTYDLRMKELIGTLYEQGLEGRRPGPGPGRGTEESFPAELCVYLSPSSDHSVPELEEIVEMIRRKKEVTWEDRVFLTLIAFKEEAGCKISSW
jgi:spore maturation protein CgeB